jgi:hypothetical protein
VAAVVVLGMLAGACGGGDPSMEIDTSATVGASADSTTDAAGCPVIEHTAPELLVVGEIIELPDAGNDHVACDGGYDHAPPTSGSHYGAWQNCGFYTEPVRDYTAVHALEHGAVWIAYRPDLPTEEIAAIEARVAGASHLLAAPYPGLRNPLVLSAWTRQLAADRMEDPEVESFIVDHAGRSPRTRAPEAGAACSGGIGIPPDDPDAGYGPR